MAVRKQFQYQQKTHVPVFGPATNETIQSLTVVTAVIFASFLNYQDVAFCPFTPTVETVTVDKWFNPLSTPRTLAKARAAEYPAFTYGALPIVSTTDRWWKNFDNPVRVKPRATDFPSFTMGTPPIVASTDRWWQNLATPPKAKPRTVEYLPFTYGPVPIVSTIDRWLQPLNTPPKAKPRSAEYPYLASGYFTPVVASTTIEWYEPLSEPVRFKSQKVAEKPYESSSGFTPADFFPRPFGADSYQIFSRTIIYPESVDVYFFTPAEVVTVDKWFNPLSQAKSLSKARVADFPAFTVAPTQPTASDQIGFYAPLREPRSLSRPRVAEFPFIAFTPTQPTASDQIGWYRPLSEPRKLSKNRAADFPAFFFGANPTDIITDMDGWWRPLETPPKAKPRTADYNAAFTPIYQLTPSDFMAGWWRPWSEPYPSKRGLRAAQQQVVAFVPGAVLETITIDKWFRPLSDPRTLKKARSADFPAFVVGYSPIVSTPDRWWQNLAVPPKAKRRSAEYPAFTYGYPPIVAVPAQWFQALSMPPEMDRRILISYSVSFSVTEERTTTLFARGYIIC